MSAGLAQRETDGRRDGREARARCRHFGRHNDGIISAVRQAFAWGWDSLKLQLAHVTAAERPGVVSRSTCYAEALAGLVYRTLLSERH